MLKYRTVNTSVGNSNAYISSFDKSAINEALNSDVINKVKPIVESKHGYATTLNSNAEKESAIQAVINEARSYSQKHEANLEERKLKEEFDKEVVAVDDPT